MIWGTVRCLVENEITLLPGYSVWVQKLKASSSWVAPTSTTKFLLEQSKKIHVLWGRGRIALWGGNEMPSIWWFLLWLGRPFYLMGMPRDEESWCVQSNIYIYIFLAVFSIIFFNTLLANKIRKQRKCFTTLPVSFQNVACKKLKSLVNLLWQCLVSYAYVSVPQGWEFHQCYCTYWLYTSRTLIMTARCLKVSRQPLDNCWAIWLKAVSVAIPSNLR